MLQSIMRLPIQLLAFPYRIKNGAPEYLLLKRIPEKGGFWLTISGGYEETDTSLVDTCYREMKEEVDIGKGDVLNVNEVVYMYQFSEFIKNKQTSNYKNLASENIVLTVYVYGFQIKEDVEPKLLEEHTEYRWCNIQEGLDLLNFKDTEDCLQALHDTLVTDDATDRK